MKKRLMTILKEQARKACPVLPTQPLEPFTNGKIVGLAVGTAILFKRLEEEGYITMEQNEELDCLLSNRDLAEVRAERAEAEALNANMEAFAEGDLQEQE